LLSWDAADINASSCGAEHEAGFVPARRAHLMIAAILFVTYVGYVLGRSERRIHPARTAVTALVALILHGLVQLALPHEVIERIAGVAARSWLPPSTFVAVAVLETAGIWIAILAVNWAALRLRIWAAAYVIGAAATLGALAHYQGFDGPVAPHPGYELWLVRRRQRGAASQDGRRNLLSAILNRL
jgi:hypothetical protein